MKKYDLESLLRDVKNLLVAKLNTKIAAVEAEKVADGFPATGLAPVDSSLGYFEQNWSDKIMTLTPVIFYGIEDVQPQGLGPVTEQVVQVFVEIVTTDYMVDDLGKTRIHRYARALREVFEENWDVLPVPKIKVKTVRPLSFKLDMNSSEELKVGGVSLTVAIA